MTTSTANVYGKALRSRTRNRIRFLVKIVRATCLVLWIIHIILKTENNDRPKIMFTKLTRGHDLTLVKGQNRLDF